MRTYPIAFEFDAGNCSSSVFLKRFGCHYFESAWLAFLLRLYVT